MNLGNILPGQKVIVTIFVAYIIKIVNGAYSFKMPIKELAPINMEGQLHVKLNTQTEFETIGSSPDVTISIDNPEYFEEFHTFENDLCIWYRTTFMDQPKFYYQRDEKSKEYALIAQFLPQFEELQP